MRKLKVQIAGKLREQSGETLLEVVVSLALFSIVALMVASMFGMADKATLRNLKTDEALDVSLTEIVKEENLDAAQTAVQNIIFYDGGGSPYTPSEGIERVTNGVFYKFRRTAP